MAVVWVTLLIGLGVMFGMASLVVDVGYSMTQGRAMQNGADAAVIAAAKVLAGSLTKDAGGNVVYTINNGAVHAVAEDYADDNRPASLGAARADYPMAVEFRACPGQEAAAGLPGAANFTFRSDPTLVAEIAAAYGATGAVRQGSDSILVPAWTCGLRVFARVAHDSLFASAIGVDSEGATARASARIFPTDPPTTVTDLWPVTRWVCNGYDDDIDDVKTDGADECDDEEHDDQGRPCRFVAGNPVPCSFWESNADPGGDFKNYVDLSRFSGLAKSQGITRAQHLTGWEPSCSVPPYDCPNLKYDTTHPGTNDKITDVPHWIRNGWKGFLTIDHTDCEHIENVTLSDPTLVTDPTKCLNSRLETFSGDIGNNIGEAMDDYIDSHLEGLDLAPDHCGTGSGDGDFATATVFFWRWGEQDTATRDSIALNDQSDLWGYYKDGLSDRASDLKRVIVYRLARFRFCRGLIKGGGNSNVEGFYVSWTNFNAPPACPAPPTPCTPSPVANTISLVE